MSKYRTIVADPPWDLGYSTIPAFGRRAKETDIGYKFMPLHEIAALPVGDLADENAHLFLWSTRRLFRDGTAAAVARAWGFNPCGEIIWGQRNAGLGGAMGNGHEPVLVARRGHLPFTAKYPVGVEFWRQTYAAATPGGQPGKVHSAKPEAFLDMVESVSPGPYLEMFARRNRFGWDTWGNEALNHVEMGAA